MRLGLPVSFFLHVALIAYALISFAKTEPFKLPEPDPVEVAIITEDGLTRLRQGDRNSKLLEAKEAPPAPKTDALKDTKKPKPPEPVAPPPEPEAAKTEPEPPPPPEKQAEKQADPIADKLAMLPPVPEPPQPSPDELAKKLAEIKAAEAKAEAERKAAEDKKKSAEAKKKLEDKKRKEAEQKRREREKKKREDKRLAALKRKQEAERKKRQPKQDDFFADMQKALKDNDPTKRAAPTGGANVASNAKQRGPTAGAPEGTDTRLTASQNAMLGLMIKDAVKRCWSIQTGAQGIESIVVKVDVRLNPDGTFAREPRVVNSMPGPLFVATADSAIRAVKQCAPYDFPKDLYKGGWESLTWTFDPRKMF